MKHSLYFMTHSHAEGGVDEDRSKYNEWEVHMVVALALYLRQ